MKIEAKDLKKQYQSYIRNKKTKKEDCPEVESIINSFLDESSSAVKFKIIDHISECGECFRKFQAIRHFSSESKKISKKLEKTSLSAQEVKELKLKAREKIFDFKKHHEAKRKVFVPPKFKWAYLSTLAAFIIIVMGIVLIFNSSRDYKTDVLRGKDEELIQLITPKGILKESPMVFTWSARPEAKAYRVILMDVELNRIWTSIKTTKTSITLPPEVFQKIKRNSLNYWKVIVFLKNDQTEESGLQKFKLKNN